MHFRRYTCRCVHVNVNVSHYVLDKFSLSMSITMICGEFHILLKHQKVNLSTTSVHIPLTLKELLFTIQVTRKMWILSLSERKLKTRRISLHSGLLLYLNMRIMLSENSTEFFVADFYCGRYLHVKNDVIVGKTYNYASCTASSGSVTNVLAHADQLYFWRTGTNM